MRKIILILCTTLSAFLAACADSSEKNAGREYVNAARKVSTAAAAFDSADYSAARALCAEAREDVRNIVEKYPDSAIALRIVTDANILIGTCKYADLSEKIIPALDLYGNADMRPVELAWIVAVSSAAPERDGALCRLAELAAANPYSSKTDSAVSEKIVSVALANVKSVDLRARVFAAIAAKRAVKPAETQRPAAPIRKASAPEKIADAEKFLAAAKSDASLVLYDLGVLGNLRKKAVSARYADKSVKEQFEKILSSAYDNILKISALSMRERALGKMAAVFADFGDDLRAIAVSRKIADSALFNSVFCEIADSLGRGKNYAEAVSLSEKLGDVSVKNKFLAELAQGVAEQGLYREAREVASKIADIPQRNAVLAKLAKSAFDNSKGDVAVSFVSALNVSNLDCLAAFDDGTEKSFGAPLLAGVRLAKLSERTASSNAKISAALNAIAAAQTRNAGASSAEGYAELCSMIARNMLYFGKRADAFDFVSSSLRTADHSDVLFGDICKIAAGAAKNSEPELAAKAFSLAADVAHTAQQAVELAFAVRAGGMPKAEAVKILKPFLPTFGGVCGR